MDENSSPPILQEDNALEQLMLLQPNLNGCAIARLKDTPESGQLIWHKDDFRVFWTFRSPLYNIGCRGHFREQIEDGCCLLVPAGVPVYFWSEGNASYCNDLEFDGKQYEASETPKEKRNLEYLSNTPEGVVFTTFGLAFSLPETLAMLAMPIFTENTIFRVAGKDFDAARVLLDQIIQLDNHNGLYGSQLTKTFLMSLIQSAQKTNQLVLTSIPREAAENPHIMQVLHIVAERINDSSLNLDSIANEVHLNASYLSGLFSQLMDKTLVRYIQEKRVLAARRLLITNPHLSIKEIMGQVGINTPQQMSRTFKKVLGCSPSEFREQLD
jgi:AraC-like DNA-binding protein